MDTVTSFTRDIQIGMTAIRNSVNCERVNVAILGNRDHHVHAHLIPRFPAEEEYPDCSPWNDTRTKEPLDEKMKELIKSRIFASLKKG